MEKLKFLGIGAALDYRMDCTSAFIKRDNKLLLLDTGENVTKKLIQLNILNAELDSIYIVISHLHPDHIAGFARLVLQCTKKLNVKVYIYENSVDFNKSLIDFLKMQNVKTEMIEFTTMPFENIKISTISTTHEKDLESYSILLEDEEGIVYYSADTNDIETVKKYAEDKTCVQMYCEVAVENLRHMHLVYEDLCKLPNKEKITLMHFITLEMYDRVKNDNLFNIPELISIKN